MSRPAGRTALYRIFGDDGTLLYVGISKDFGQRWKQEAKDFPWWDEHRRMTVDWCDSRPEAEAAEMAAIGTEGPKYNIRRPPVPQITPRRPAPSGPPPALLTYREAAAKIGISRSLLYRLLRNGEIRNLVLGPQERRIALDECEAYVERLKAEQWGPSSQVPAA